jgi:hypothetical protein
MASHKLNSALVRQVIIGRSTTSNFRKAGCPSWNCIFIVWTIIDVETRRRLWKCWRRGLPVDEDYLIVFVASFFIVIVDGFFIFSSWSKIQVASFWKRWWFAWLHGLLKNPCHNSPLSSAPTRQPYLLWFVLIIFLLFWQYLVKVCSIECILVLRSLLGLFFQNISLLLGLAACSFENQNANMRRSKRRLSRQWESTYHTKVAGDVIRYEGHYL